MEELSNNLRRLIGLHGLSVRDLAPLVGVSEQALSEIQTRKRKHPRTETSHRLADFFEIPLGRLLSTPFEELLQADLADPERYAQVEGKIPRDPRYADR